MRTVCRSVHVEVAQSCPTLRDPMDGSPPGCSVLGDSPGKKTGAGGHALLQGIFPTQGSNPGLLHCRRVLYRLSPRVACAQLLSVLLSCVSEPVQTGLTSRIILIFLPFKKEDSCVVLTVGTKWFLLSYQCCRTSMKEP